MIYTFLQLMIKGDAFEALSLQCRFDLIEMIISVEVESNILASRTKERRRTSRETTITQLQACNTTRTASTFELCLKQLRQKISAIIHTCIRK